MNNTLHKAEIITEKTPVIPENNDVVHIKTKCFECLRSCILFMFIFFILTIFLVVLIWFINCDSDACKALKEISQEVNKFIPSKYSN